MEIQITAKNIKLTPAIKTYTQTRLDKIEQHFETAVWAQVLLSVEKKINQRAEVIIHVDKKKTISASAVENDLYKAIEEAVHKAEQQIKKLKEKSKSKTKKLRKEVRGTIIEPAYTITQSDVKFSVIKQVEASPMNPEDAAYEMERLGYTFWMFLDEDSKQINLIFKRLDGTYGLIKPIKKK